MVRVVVDIVCMGRDETSVKTWQILELAVLEQTDACPFIRAPDGWFGPK